MSAFRSSSNPHCDNERVAFIEENSTSCSWRALCSLSCGKNRSRVVEPGLGSLLAMGQRSAILTGKNSAGPFSEVNEARSKRRAKDGFSGVLPLCSFVQHTLDSTHLISLWFGPAAFAIPYAMQLMVLEPVLRTVVWRNLTHPYDNVSMLARRTRQVPWLFQVGCDEALVLTHFKVADTRHSFGKELCTVKSTPRPISNDCLTLGISYYLSLLVFVNQA